MFSLLICPYCKKFLSFRFLNKSNNKSYGIAKCGCDEYPIVEEIIYLLKDDGLLNRRVVALLKRGKYTKAVWKCLTNSAKTHKFLVFFVYLLKRYFKINLPLSYTYKLLKLIGPSRDWFEYLLKRGERDDIHIAFKLIQKNYDPERLFIDIGFGTGSFLETFGGGYKPKIKSYIGIDKNFFSLLIAKVYTKTSNPLLVCSDVEFGIPIKSNAASDILLLVCLCHLYNKSFALSEVYRVLKKNGSIYIVDCYETTPKTYYWGYGIKAKDLHSLMENYFEKMKFMDNSLSASDKIKYLPLKLVPKEGYSVTAKKK